MFSYQSNAVIFFQCYIKLLHWKEQLNYVYNWHLITSAKLRFCALYVLFNVPANLHHHPPPFSTPPLPPHPPSSLPPPALAHLFLFFASHPSPDPTLFPFTHILRIFSPSSPPRPAHHLSFIPLLYTSMYTFNSLHITSTHASLVPPPRPLSEQHFVE